MSKFTYTKEDLAGIVFLDRDGKPTNKLPDYLTPEYVMNLDLGRLMKLSPHERAWLTVVYRDNVQSEWAQKAWAPVKEHLERIGYRPASDEPTPPARKARRGKGSY